MSRSYKKRPFMAITGDRSAKRDKVYAHRGERRAQNRVLRNTTDYENLFLPHFRECPGNNTYDWGRDGNQHWFGLRAKDENDPYPRGRWGDGMWPPAWYVQMMRK